MTAIINCRHSTIKGGFRRIQQCRGKRKIEGKSRTEFTMKNTAEGITQNKQGTPKSTCAEDTAVCHNPDLQSSLQGAPTLSTTQSRLGHTGRHHQHNPCQVPELHRATATAKDLLCSLH